MAEPWQVANEAGYESAQRSTPLQLLSYRTFSYLVAIFDGGNDRCDEYICRHCLPFCFSI